MSIIVASQFDEDFNAALRAHPLKPAVIPVPGDRPWSVANDADALLVRPTPSWEAHIQTPRPESWPGRLRWIFSGSVGLDRYPAWLLDDVPVSCSRGVYSGEIADYVISAIYAHGKNLEAVRARSPQEWRDKKPLGRVAGSTVGIIGLGDIGAEVARRVLPLGAHVVAARRRQLASPVEGVELLADPGEVVARADHIVIAVPATDATRGLVDAGLLAKAKPGAHLINIARGSVVDQSALLVALDSGRLAFATLDVTYPEPLPEGHPLWTHPRVLLTPHISTNYAAVRQAHLAKILADFGRFARGQQPSDLVDPATGY